MIYFSEFICGILLTTFLTTLPYSAFSCVALLQKTLHCSRTGLFFFFIPQIPDMYTCPLLLLVKSSIPFSDSHSSSHNCVFLSSTPKTHTKKGKWKSLGHVQLFANFHGLSLVLLLIFKMLFFQPEFNFLEFHVSLKSLTCDCTVPDACIITTPLTIILEIMMPCRWKGNTKFCDCIC